ncbi:Brain-specific angiogenesis inhibitor 1-associated protein 2-like protein 2 [Frankliniella fusca]|uniref:Brain-specific angiogenesis inhibitor 1-associated protein 2-like protein 2 n=1 Tax=Frankliniella fusca TaxID=407009 RepID=A0AAE1HEL1_9NEOP|nr:Brain-specific angiogenesis inhibitor 1-associated protein 2-like protein 2 [Frankliniella fusca]
MCCHDNLASEEHIQNHLNYDRELVIYFIKTFIDKYTSHNIHNSLHLVDDCKEHGSLDKFSAFPFENFYQKLKRLIRKGDKPLQQLCRRYEEQKFKKACGFGGKK